MGESIMKSKYKSAIYITVPKMYILLVHYKFKTLYAT